MSHTIRSVFMAAALAFGAAPDYFAIFPTFDLYDGGFLDSDSIVIEMSLRDMNRLRRAGAGRLPVLRRADATRQ